MKKILVINPGSTSTKFAVYHDEERIFSKTLQHLPEELRQFASIFDQQDYRLNLILKALEKEGIALDFDAVAARGGLAKPSEGGAFLIDEYMIEANRTTNHHHACDLGCALAFEVAKRCGVKSYIADPGVVDERTDEARFSGLPEMPHETIWHALNQKAIARRYAAERGVNYEDLNLIICHLGGGVSVGAHSKGRAIDTPNALDGAGPFSPERSGTLPAGTLIHMCYSGKYTEAQMMKKLAGQGGLVAHLGTTDAIEIENRIEAGDEHAKKVYDAMIYHIARAIAADGATLYGKVDAILITGGLARSPYVVDRIKERVEYLAPVFIYPGEDELLALAQNALAILEGKMEAKIYPREDTHAELYKWATKGTK